MHTKESIIDLMKAELERLHSTDAPQPLVEGFQSALMNLEHGGADKEQMHEVVSDLKYESMEPVTSWTGTLYARGLRKGADLIHAQLEPHAHIIVWEHEGDLI